VWSYSSKFLVIVDAIGVVVAQLCVAGAEVDLVQRTARAKGVDAADALTLDLVVDAVDGGRGGALVFARLGFEFQTMPISELHDAVGAQALGGVRSV
jgi:hypothetical protein